MDFNLIIAFLVLGTFTGFAAGLLGIGGGMLLVPFITMLLTLNGFPAELRVVGKNGLLVSSYIDLPCGGFNKKLA